MNSKVEVRVTFEQFFEQFFEEMCRNNDIFPDGDYAKDIKDYCRLAFFAGLTCGKKGTV